MKLETSTVLKLRLTELQNLDPLNVYLEDLGRRACPIEGNPDYWTGQGQLTVRCYDQSWTAFWGGMGQQSLVEFVASCNVHYLLNCLNRGLQPTKFCAQSVQKYARQRVCEQRRGKYLTKDEAREIWYDLAVLDGISHPDGIWANAQLMQDAIGDDWQEDLRCGKADAPNDDYLYLERIVSALKQGLTLYLEQTNEAGPSGRDSHPA